MLRVTSTPPARRFSRQSRILVAVGVFFALIFGLFGGVLVGVSQKDYTAYTERATATISDVVRETGEGDPPPQLDVPDLRRLRGGRPQLHAQAAAGRDHRDPHVGDTVELLYPPGQPDKAVTAETTSKTTARVLLWIGVGLLVIAVGILVGLVVWGRRRRAKRLPAAPDAAFAVPAPAPVADPRLLPVPWPWEQVVAQLARAAEDAPFAVTPLPDGGVDVTYDVANARWFTLFQAHRLTSTFVCRLHPRKPGSYARNDTLYDVEWSGGVGGLRGSGRVQSGRVWSRHRRVDYGIGTDGSVGRQVDVDFSSSDVPRWIDTVLAGSGWKSALDANARGGLVAAVAGGAVAVVGVVVAVVATR
ncbi:hypothetical protein GCM10025864_01710 [Luteimicrobium album]|uniref:DUF3592 domain-containing protein n=2 Tax=Luteimicrobium album TaxID=1054550 RepID=A0ABQ6HWQ6_9MICO|nr:hypothetical protein GCM10025864_01710 [Luteimicrobium album]